jgi:hypothetical protein
MKYCNECLNSTTNYYYIGNKYYCINCTKEYMLIKCPSIDCTNVISLNGYKFDNTDENICTSCEAQFCDNCIVKNMKNNIIICKECFYI